MLSSVEAQTITLDFNSLPSLQGWTYVSDGAPEASIFSVSGGVLTQDTDNFAVRFSAQGIETPPLRSALEDIDGDGDTDMVLQFDTQSTGIACGDASASLTGKALSGQAIQGFDSINTVGCT